MRNNTTNVRMLAIFAALALVIGFIPSQALASAGESAGLYTEATPGEYLQYQAVMDELNAEYGTAAWIKPYSEYVTEGLPLPKAPTPEGLKRFRESQRESIEKIETMNLEAQLSWVSICLDPTSDTCINPDSLAGYCTNTSPWGVQTMLDIIAREGYGEDVIRFVASHNPAFAAAAVSFQRTGSEEEQNAIGTPISNSFSGSQLSHGSSRGWYTSTISYLVLGKSNLEGNREYSNGWYWHYASRGYWTASLGYPFFQQIGPSTLSGTGSAVCTVLYYGLITNFDLFYQIYAYNYTYLNISHSAG